MEEDDDMVKTLKCTTLLAMALASWFALAAPSHAAPNPPAQPTVVDRADLDRSLSGGRTIRMDEMTLIIILLLFIILLLVVD